MTPDLTEFLAGLNIFYLGTSSAEGQPYIQYRGGFTIEAWDINCPQHIHKRFSLRARFNP